MITYIEIIDFKAINNEKLKLMPLTILTGANSSGKSSVIQAIMLLIKHSKLENKYSMEEVVSYLNDFSTIRNKKTNAKEINITIIDNEENKHSLNLNFDSFQLDSQLAYLYEAKNNINEPELFYLNANRLGAQPFSAISDRRVGAMGEFILSTFEKIKLNLIHNDLIKSSESKTLAYQLSYWLSHITEIPTELITEKVGDRVNVAYTLKDLAENISPFNLGAGISYLAKVLIICLMAKKGDLILLENPEVQLHPKSQAKLGEFLSFVASKGIQLIVETHCEHLINRVRLEVSNENINCDDVIIHYKSSSKEPFQTLYLDINGHFVDNEENRLSFPSGFFDASVDALLSLR